jgi:hypothetical protein
VSRPGVELGSPIACQKCHQLNNLAAVEDAVRVAADVALGTSSTNSSLTLGSVSCATSECLLILSKEAFLTKVRYGTMTT